MVGTGLTLRQKVSLLSDIDPRQPALARRPRSSSGVPAAMTRKVAQREHLSKINSIGTRSLTFRRPTQVVTCGFLGINHPK